MEMSVCATEVAALQPDLGAVANRYQMFQERQTDHDWRMMLLLAENFQADAQAMIADCGDVLNLAEETLFTREIVADLFPYPEETP